MTVAWPGAIDGEEPDVDDLQDHGVVHDSPVDETLQNAPQLTRMLLRNILFYPSKKTLTEKGCMMLCAGRAS